MPIRLVLAEFKRQLELEKSVFGEEFFSRDAKQDQQKLKMILLSELINILTPLVEIGLGFLNLRRKVNSLSGGEIQRTNLIKVISNKTTNVTYILDEPSIGLHPNDNKALMQKLRELIANGNSIILIEHDLNFIKSADHLIVLDNGKVKFTGAVSELLKTNLPLAEFLRGELFISQRISEVNNELHQQDLFWLKQETSQDSLASSLINVNSGLHKNLSFAMLEERAHHQGISVYEYLSAFNPKQQLAYDVSSKMVIKGLAKNYFKNIDVELHKGLINVITGISGSGKSTLAGIIEGVAKVIIAKEKTYKELDFKEKMRIIRDEFKIQDCLGFSDKNHNSYFENVVHARQRPDNSNLALLDYFDISRPLGRVFESAARREKISIDDPLREFDFRLNSHHNSHRCPVCKGKTSINVNFGDTQEQITCYECNGTGYDRKVLTVYLQYDVHSQIKHNIADMNNMSVSEAYDFFIKYHAKYPSTDVKALLAKLGQLKRFRLGNLTLAEKVSSFSGGEIQRLYVTKELSAYSGKAGNLLIILDEPTTGLHFNDVQSLLDFMVELKNQGHTIVIIEHNIEFIYNADHLVELGPGADIDGGEIIFSGSIDHLLSKARYLESINPEHLQPDDQATYADAYLPSLNTATKSLQEDSANSNPTPSFNNDEGKFALMYTPMMKYLSEYDRHFQNIIANKVAVPMADDQNLPIAGIDFPEDYDYSGDRDKLEDKAVKKLPSQRKKASTTSKKSSKTSKTKKNDK